MTAFIGRREFIALLGGAAATWPVAARAQQPTMPVIGFLNGQSRATSAQFVLAFHQGLAEVGFIEGRNVAIEYRSAEGETDRLPALAAELVRRQVVVIAAVGGDNSVLAAKAATATIPIVFVTGGDPVETGLVASLNQPGGNVTGASFLGSMVAAKQIGLLRDMVPKIATIGVLMSPANPMAPTVAKDVQAAVQAVDLKVVVVETSNERDIDTAFAQFVERRVDALVISSAVLFQRLMDRLVALAASHAIPAIFTARDFAAAGGLMSYGTDIKDAYRQAGVYVGRILKGEKPAGLPVMQAAKFELIVNLKTAKALGLTVPAGLLAIADEVIE
jgi:putative ABC transport system substrate-binding protein